VAQRVEVHVKLHPFMTEALFSSTPRPPFTPGKDLVPILLEAGWAPGPVWTDGKSCPHRDWIPDRPAPSQSLYRLSYPAQKRELLRYLKLLSLSSMERHEQIKTAFVKKLRADLFLEILSTVRSRIS